MRVLNEQKADGKQIPQVENIRRWKTVRKNLSRGSSAKAIVGKVEENKKSLGTKNGGSATIRS
jgi:hypothetical protein